MSIVKTIYKLKPKFEINNNKEISCSIETENYEIVGYGWSKIHPDDKDFESELVGKNIAYSRAIINALHLTYETVIYDYKVKKQVYDNLLREYFDPQLFDPQEVFKRDLDRTKTKANKLHKAMIAERRKLDNYLQSLDIAHNRIRELRAKQNNKF